MNSTNTKYFYLTARTTLSLSTSSIKGIQILYITAFNQKQTGVSAALQWLNFRKDMTSYSQHHDYEGFVKQTRQKMLAFCPKNMILT